MNHQSKTIDLQAILAELGPRFAERSAALEASDSFVFDNYAELKMRGVFSAQVPTDLGGPGVKHSEVAAFLRGLAGYCPSTALALSMHQHLVSAASKNHRDGKPGAALLSKVLEGELVLVSTGANDWLDSGGEAVKVEGGYRINAFKSFASGSPVGDLAITSCAFNCPVDGPSVIHFPLSLKAEGVTLMGDWESMGMRATGSQTIQFKDVFVADAAVGMKRPRGPFHPAFAVIVTVAMPLIMSVYVGIAEAAAALARKQATRRPADAVAAIQLGELENLLTTAQLAVDSMVALADDLRFTPSAELASQILVRKSICAGHVVAATEKALEVAGGGGFFRKHGLERLLRDVHAGQFHPLPEKRQQLFTGRLAAGLPPVESPFGN
ncbi:acyl-CoA dehydrogenase family protein [Pseudokordiimonas caeni]|uniref:acyl-CoA dehydrogenase family protein n=1 Tax=Pseudokordiimonas caeni TaxID=2997908 RepID=UPI0028116C2C|nr:acyl-CoA dehydrogenase family protein [Pseudokordiimonas caeni]